MKKLPYIALLLIATACANDPKQKTETKQADTVLTESPEALETAAQLGGIADFSASYEGSINDTYRIVMQLTKTGSTLGGSYSYVNKNIPIELNGTIAEDGRIELSEMSKGAVTGVFNGQLRDGTFSGTWSKADNSSSMPFSVAQTQIESMQMKADVLSHAMGTYYLRSIEGNMGANTMFDTYLEKGKWESSSSSNIGGQREGSKNELDKKDIDLLNNLHITVDDAMNVHLYAGLIELFNSPYKAQGMTYRIRQKDKAQLNERLAALSADTILYSNKYVLLADDNMSFAKILQGSFDLVTENNMILSYIPANNTFELEIFQQQCCDGNVLVFGRK